MLMAMYKVKSKKTFFEEFGVKKLDGRALNFTMNLNGTALGMRCPISIYKCDGQVCTNFWPYSIL